VRVQSPRPYDIITGHDDNGDTVSSDRPVGMSRNSARGDALADVGARVAWSKGFGRRPTSGGAPDRKRARAATTAMLSDCYRRFALS
jgi:hypothetical protein